MPSKTIFTPTFNACQYLTLLRIATGQQFTLQIISIGRVRVGSMEPPQERYMLELSDTTHTIQAILHPSLNRLVNEGKLRYKTIFVTRALVKSGLDMQSTAGHPFTIEDMHIDDDEIMQSSVLLGSPTPLSTPDKHIIPLAAPIYASRIWEAGPNSSRDPMVVTHHVKCMRFDPETGYARDPTHIDNARCYFAHPTDGHLWQQARTNTKHEAEYQKTGLVGIPSGRSEAKAGKSRHKSIARSYSTKKTAKASSSARADPRLTSTAEPWASPFWGPTATLPTTDAPDVPSYEHWGTASPARTTDSWGSTSEPVDTWDTSWATSWTINPPMTPPRSPVSLGLFLDGSPANAGPSQDEGAWTESGWGAHQPLSTMTNAGGSSPTLTHPAPQGDINTVRNDFDTFPEVGEVLKSMEPAADSVSHPKIKEDAMDVDNRPWNSNPSPRKRTAKLQIGSKPKPENPQYEMTKSRLKLHVQGYQTLQKIQYLTQEIELIASYEHPAKSARSPKVSNLKKEHSELSRELERIVTEIQKTPDAIWLSAKSKPPSSIPKGDTESPESLPITTNIHDLSSELENIRQHRLSSPSSSTQPSEQLGANVLGKRKAAEALEALFKRHSQRLAHGIRGIQSIAVDIQDRVLSAKNELEAFSDNLHGRIEAEIGRLTSEADEAAFRSQERYRSQLDRARTVDSRTLFDAERIQGALDFDLGYSRAGLEKMKERLIKLEQNRPTVIAAATILVQSPLNPDTLPAPLGLDQLVDEVLKTKSEFSTKVTVSLETVERLAEKTSSEVKKRVLVQLYPTLDIHSRLLEWMEQEPEMRDV